MLFYNLSPTFFLMLLIYFLPFGVENNAKPFSLFHLSFFSSSLFFRDSTLIRLSRAQNFYAKRLVHLNFANAKNRCMLMESRERLSLPSSHICFPMCTYASTNIICMYSNCPTNPSTALHVICIRYDCGISYSSYSLFPIYTHELAALVSFTGQPRNDCMQELLSQCKLTNFLWFTKIFINVTWHVCYWTFIMFSS